MAELKQFGIDAMVHDPLGNPHDALEEYDIVLSSLDTFQQLDAAILAVSHAEYLANPLGIFERVKDGGAVIDIKSVLPVGVAPRGIQVWSL